MDAQWIGTSKHFAVYIQFSNRSESIITITENNKMYRRGEKYKTKPGRTYFFINQPGFPEKKFTEVR